MRTKDIVIGFVFLVILVAGILMIKNRAKIGKVVNPSATPTVQQKIEDKFKGLIVPEDVERAELKDVTGGESFGLATRSEILADLPEAASGQFYQGWLEKDGKKVLLGSFRLAKGGYILEYNSSKYPGYNKVIVTQGAKSILEGSF